MEVIISGLYRNHQQIYETLYQLSKNKDSGKIDLLTDVIYII